MTSRQLKQQAVKASILNRRQRETGEAIIKNGGPITEKQVFVIQMIKAMKRANYNVRKSRITRAKIACLKHVVTSHPVAEAILENHPIAEYQGND